MIRLVGRLLKIDKENGTADIRVKIDDAVIRQMTSVECVFRDGREITAEQRKKIYGLFNDMYRYTGHDVEFLKEWTKSMFCGLTGEPMFSLSDVDESTASHFMDWLIEFCITHNIPMSENPILWAPDKRRAEYACIMQHCCCVCGRPHADLHHIDQIGSERRQRANHLGRMVLTLCRVHHNEYHDDREKFMKKYDLIGIEADEKICKEFDLHICAEVDG